MGQFFLPFAQTVCVSLVASTLVALTAVPALGSVLLRQGDMASEDGDSVNRDTWLLRVYTPLLRWALRHRFITVASCVIVVTASLSLIIVLPITLFSAEAVDRARIDVTMPESTSAGAMFREVLEIEQVLQSYVDAGYITSYQVTMGELSEDFGPAPARAAVTPPASSSPFPSPVPPRI